MSPLHRAVAVPCALALALACAHAPRDAKPDQAKAPGQPAQAGGPLEALPKRTYRVRAYADGSYRAQAVVRWEERARKQLARASEVTSRRFNVTFQLVDSRPWNATPPPAEPLGAVLEKLEALDPGQDVDLVIGYTGSLPSFTGAVDQLGAARALGRHLVLRGMESPEEERAIRESLQDIPEHEREALSLQRRAHKEISVFLHQWGHTLGAPHTPVGLMNETYSRKASFFTPEAVAVMAIGLVQKPGGLDDLEVRAAWSKDVRAWLETEDGKALAEGARKYLAALAAAGSADLEAVLGRADREQMTRAIQEDRAGRHAEAAELLRPLLERHPRQPRLTAVACQVQIHAGAAGDAAWELCRRAAQLDPKGPSTALFVADLADRRKDPSAPEALARARAALEQVQGALPDHWLYLAGLHRQRQEVSLAESALDRAGEQKSSAEVRDWARRTRRWVGLVPGAVPPEREGEYVAEFRQAQVELEQGKLARAKERIDALEKIAGGAVGALTLRCELKIRQGAGPRGLPECRTALERFPESVHAHYLLGMVLGTHRAWPEAAAALERVLELDPTVPDAWPRLGEAYRATGNATASAALKERYQQRFGKPAPFK